MRYTITLILLFISFLCAGQAFTNDRSSSSITVQDARWRGRLTMYLPHTHGLTLNGGLDTVGAMIYEDSSRHVWFRDTVLSGGHKWTMLLTTAGIDVNVVQNYTSGSTVTVMDGVNILRLNPGTVVGSLVITMPAIPHNSKSLLILGGGTLANGVPIVNNYMLVGNAGQVIYTSNNGTLNGGDRILLNMDGVNWY